MDRAFEGLTKLEFQIEENEIRAAYLADKIVGLAKDRSYSTMGHGLSIVVNTRDKIR